MNPQGLLSRVVFEKINPRMLQRFLLEHCLPSDRSCPWSALNMYLPFWVRGTPGLWGCLIFTALLFFLQHIPQCPRVCKKISLHGEGRKEIESLQLTVFYWVSCMQAILDISQWPPSAPPQPAVSVAVTRGQEGHSVITPPWAWGMGGGVPQALVLLMLGHWT